jgi:hypothetical protein
MALSFALMASGCRGTESMTPPDQKNVATPNRRRPSAGAVDRRPHLGPFYVGVASTAVSAVLLIALACGMPMTMLTVLSIIIPGMVVSTTLLSVSMAWVFILFGRTKRVPRWIPGVGIMVVLTMGELFALTYLSSLAQQ